MNGQKAKSIRKEEKALIAEYEQRRDAFRAEITAASEKYQVGLVGGLQYRDTALISVILFVDEKGKYGHVTDEAKAAEAGKKLIV